MPPFHFTMGDKNPPQPLNKDTCTMYPIQAEHGLNGTRILALIQEHIKISEKIIF